MDWLVRSLNDERFYSTWLSIGVADGDIDDDTPDDELDIYTDDDESFADLMDTFLALMSSAYKSGGLYVDGVVSRPSNY